MDPAQLRRILLDLQCVDVLQPVLGDLDKLGARMQLQFGEACRLTGQQMTGRVLDFTEQAFVTAPGIGAFVGETGVQALLARMDFSRELVALFRRLSPRLFGKETDRQRLVEAAQEHLDGLVSLEEEAGQEKGDEA
jgi:type III secretion system TyeA family effector delivery regulator